MRRPITGRMHAMLDYPLAVVLIASPWIFGFSDVGGAAVALPIIIGALALGQSLITDWDLSVAKIVPLPIHLTLDALAGIVLASSPFVLGFSDEGTNAWLPLVVAGVGMVNAGLMTQRSPETRPGALAAGPGDDDRGRDGSGAKRLVAFSAQPSALRRSEARRRHPDSLTPPRSASPR